MPNKGVLGVTMGPLLREVVFYANEESCRCCVKDPGAIRCNARPNSLGSNHFDSVELTYRGGSLSEIRSFRRRIMSGT